MTNTLKNIIGLISLGIVSCNSGSKTEQIESLTIPKHQEVSITYSDSVLPKFQNKTIDTTSLFQVDDYPVKKAQLIGKYSEINSGKTKSYDKAWFRNDSIHQSLVFELYTDYHRFVTYCFDNDNIPIELIERLELHIEGGDLAPLNQKQKDLHGFIKQAVDIRPSYFISNKGVSIGMVKQQAIQLYGEPNDTKRTKKFEILEWKFSGDMQDNPETNKIARDSFGHGVTMFFDNNKLVAQILFNDIP